MIVRWHPWILSLFPGLISGLIWVGDAAIRPHITGECDPKLTCWGWVQVASCIAALSLLLSAIGISAGASRYGDIARRLSFFRVLILVCALTTLLLAMLYTMGWWPVDSLAAHMFLWVAITFVATCVLLLLCRRLTSNNSFKVTPDGAPQLDR
jgi:hypothetical protein